MPQSPRGAVADYRRPELACRRAVIFCVARVVEVTKMAVPELTRRSVLSAALAPVVASLGGCATPLPLTQRPSGLDPAARALLLQSAMAHGLPAYRSISDINIAYDGQWSPAINSVQPEVVDASFRGSSEERLMPGLGLNSQHYTGPKGRKFVAWQRGAGKVAVWFNGQPSNSNAMLTAAALVADVYGLFLLAPLWLMDQKTGEPASRVLALQMGATENVDGRLCDVVRAWLTPGWGQSGLDRVDLCVARDNQVALRTRFSLEGFAGTQGAVAETDNYEHQMRHGVLWPMRSFERVVHPIALPAHNWHITGLDVNRGYAAQAISGPEFSSAAAAPAKPV
jgi:hypothetical protein